jgi:hypothetical protein
MTRVAELETYVLDAKLEIDSLKANVVSNEVDCGDCSVFLVDLTALKENYASKCEELDVLGVELAEVQSRPTLLGACTSCLGLHEKLAELRSRIVSLEAHLEVPIPTSCSTCELHGVKNLELAQCVDHLQYGNDKLHEVLSWLSSQESELRTIIASFKRFDGWLWDLISLVRAMVRENHKIHPRTSLHPSQTSCLNQERNQERSQVKSLVRNQVRSLVKGLIPDLCQNQCVSIVRFVGRMVIRKSFAIRGRERQECLRSGRTRIGNTLLTVCLSLACHYLWEKVLCIQFQHVDIGQLQVEAGLLAEDHRQNGARQSAEQFGFRGCDASRFSSFGHGTGGRLFESSAGVFVG